MTEQQIPKGYKLTEVGVIPEDWSLLTIESNATLKARIGWQALTTKEYLLSGDYVLVTGTDFESGFINWETCFYVSEWRYKQDRNIQLNESDVLVTKDGTIGKVGYIHCLPKSATLNSGIFVIRPKDNKFYPLFLFYILRSKFFDSFIKKITAGSTITHLYQKDFVKFVFFAPLFEEQTAIANALSDTDALIHQLKKLITKKQAIKTATMQQLLTGKTRLPEFAYRADGSLKDTKISELGEIPEDWEVIELGAISTFFKGKGLSKKDIQDFGEDKCIHYGQLFTTYAEKIENVISSVIKKNGSYIYSKFNDILMPTSDVTPSGLATASCIQINDVILGGDILIIRANIELLNGIFFSYLVKILEHKVMQLVTGITVYHLYGKDLANLAIYLPSFKEQTSIVTILSEMDQEITTLETRLAKTEQIKQGMMQQLLTGKIRLL